jgi:hypothetical protein
MIFNIIDRSWYQRNSSETKSIMIYPRVYLLQNPQCLVSTAFQGENRQEILLKGTLEKLGYVPGELYKFKIHEEF